MPGNNFVESASSQLPSTSSVMEHAAVDYSNGSTLDVLYQHPVFNNASDVEALSLNLRLLSMSAPVPTISLRERFIQMTRSNAEAIESITRFRPATSGPTEIASITTNQDDNQLTTVSQAKPAIFTRSQVAVAALLATDLLENIYYTLVDTATGQKVSGKPIKNCVRGPHACVDAYKRIHMNMLCNDYIANLRGGLEQMLQTELPRMPRSQYESNSTFTVYERKSIDIHLGKLVVFLSTHEANSIRRAQQEKKKREKLAVEKRQKTVAGVPQFPETSPQPTVESNYEEDQWSSQPSGTPFMKGSLLLFTSSPSHFNELIVAKVVRQHIDDPERPPRNNPRAFQLYRQRKMENPWHAHIEIDLVRVFGRPTGFLAQPLYMLEPSQYFDPTHQTHSCIGKLSDDSMPFASELIEASQLPRTPEYLSAQEDVVYYHPQTGHALPLLRDTTSWPSADLLGYNESQMQALHHALTARVAMIQGPPGTGKSFVGRELLGMLLHNTEHRIVVVCLSNQALDQFLCGLVEHTPYGTPELVVRMGAQTTQPELLNDLLEFSAPPCSESGPEISKAIRKCDQRTAEVCTSLCSDVGGQPLNVQHTNTILATQNAARTRLEGVLQSAKFSKLHRRRVFAMTSSFAARNSVFLDLVAAPIVIVDEAAEMLEAHVLAALNKHTQHFIQIGDHQQLRPRCCSNSSVSQVQMDVSLFERLHNNQLPSVTLNVQHRAHPELADLIRPSIYPQLADAEAVRSHPPVRGMAARVSFVDHRFEETRVGTSISNAGEAQLIRAFCAYLLQQGYRHADIAVLCTYRAQVAQLELGDGRGTRTCHGCSVSTVDSFQGREARIVLVSLVRNNGEGTVGFMAAANRACVALSRARDGAYLFGNLEQLASKSAAWTHVKVVLEAVPHGVGQKALTVQCETHRVCNRVASAADFDAFAAGGCAQQCEQSLPCGHACRLRCHGAAVAHACQMECHETVQLCGHKCTFAKCHAGWQHRCGVQCTGVLPACGHTCVFMGCHEGLHLCGECH